MAETLARNPIALRRFITYEALGKVPVFEAYKNLCKRFGEDVMNYVDYEFWYYRALHRELDVNYDRSVDPRQPALLELPMEMLWSIFAKASPIERLIVRKVCTRLQTCVDTMYNKIDEIRFDSTFDGPVEIKYENDVVQYRGDKDCSVFRYSIQPHRNPAVVKNVDRVELAIRDLSISLRNPKLRLKSLYIYVKSERMPHFHQAFVSLNHQLHVEKLEFYIRNGTEDTMILPYLKPGTLKEIEIHVWDSDEEIKKRMSRLGQIIQCREAKMLKIYVQYEDNFPIECFLNCRGLTLVNYGRFINAETTIRYIGILQTSTVFESFSVKNHDSDELIKAIRGGGRPLWNDKAAIAELGERNKEEKAFPTMRLDINNKFEEGGAATRNEGDRDVEREGKFKDSEERACLINRMIKKAAGFESSAEAAEQRRAAGILNF